VQTRGGNRRLACNSGWIVGHPDLFHAVAILKLQKQVVLESTKRPTPFLKKSIGWKAASWKRFWKSGAQPHPQGVNEPVDSRGSVTITPLRPLHMAQQNAYSLFIRLLYRVT